MRFLCNAESAISTCDSNYHKQPFKLKRFSYSDLQTATNGFSHKSVLGKGSHGVVYHAVLDNGALTVAVKKSTVSVTETAENEIEILSKIRSRRIVNLIGYAVDSEVPPKLLLVVEYMPNGSLYDFLHKNRKPTGLLTRVRFALQIAKAVRTLHRSNPPVMHRDIKSSNVLIDGRENARLGDFGLAIKGHVEDIRAMATPPAGTLGYLDPCYLAPGDLSTKSDVFSFGILLLEILSGRKAIDVEYSPPSIVEWALPLIKSGSYHAILDRRIKGHVDQTVVRELCVLAARCVRSTAEKRPPVSEIVHCLEKVYRRVKLQGIPVWNNIRRRVKIVERSQPLNDFDGSDWEEDRVRPRRKSLLERNKKVSNVERNSDPTEEKLTRVSSRTVGLRSRSKSTGSFREISKVGPVAISEINKNSSSNIVVKKKGQVTVKLGAVKLSKSRSMGILYSGEKSQVKKVEMFPLLVNSNRAPNSSSF